LFIWGWPNAEQLPLAARTQDVTPPDRFVKPGVDETFSLRAAVAFVGRFEPLLQ
jgi:hypothetical protein